MEATEFFEVKISGKQVLLRVQTPEGARKASLKEIQKDLRRREISYRHETLFDIYRRASNEFEPLANQEVRTYQLSVGISEDAQQAYLTVVPPDTGEDQLTPAKIKEALESARVEKGILYSEIKRILASGKGQERVLIAKGVLNKHGVDGRIEFEERPNERLALGDNTADYRELGLIDNVFEDDLIAHITPPTGGSDGYDVRANTLRGRPGKKAKFKLGRNVRLSDDGTGLFASEDGYVVRTGVKISVENILEVNNVDSETGNIRFHGVVHVRGQVEDNYVIEAEKGIEVGATVGKAHLKTKGDIRVDGGVLGASLECDGNVSARFLSDAKVKSGINVLVKDYILHSEVVARRAVRVENEQSGFIKGGRTRAGTEIWSPVVGSDVSEEATVLEVGGGVNVRKRFDLLEERLEINLEGYGKIRKNLLYLERQRETEGPPKEGRKMELYKQTVESGRKMSTEILQQAKLHHHLLQDLANPQEDFGFVMISQQANPGVTIQIQTNRVNLKDVMESCGFSIIGGGLKAMPYGTALKLHKQSKAKRVTT